MSISSRSSCSYVMWCLTWRNEGKYASHRWKLSVDHHQNSNPVAGFVRSDVTVISSRCVLGSFEWRIRAHVKDNTKTSQVYHTWNAKTNYLHNKVAHKMSLRERVVCYMLSFWIAMFGLLVVISYLNSLDHYVMTLRLTLGHFAHICIITWQCCHTYMINGSPAVIQFHCAGHDFVAQTQ